MSATARYRILDEPTPSTLARFAVDPLWPLLAMAMTGTLIGGSWFVFNAFAIGSATRKREAIVLALTFVGMAVTFMSLDALESTQGVDFTGAVPYIVIGLHVLRIIPAYFVHAWQSRSYVLFEYLGGTPRRGLWLLIALNYFFIKVRPDLPPLLRTALFL